MVAGQTGLRPQARNRRPDITTVLGSFRWARAAASSSSSSASLANPIASTCGRMLRTRSMRTVRRVCPAGYIGALASTSTSVSPAARNSSGTLRPMHGSAPLRAKATVKISQIRANAFRWSCESPLS